MEKIVLNPEAALSTAKRLLAEQTTLLSVTSQQRRECQAQHALGILIERRSRVEVYIRGLKDIIKALESDI